MLWRQWTDLCDAANQMYDLQYQLKKFSKKIKTKENEYNEQKLKGWWRIDPWAKKHIKLKFPKKITKQREDIW